MKPLRRLAWIGLVVVTAGCGREFDQAVWQHPGCDFNGGEGCDVRHEMVGSVKRKFPAGTRQAEVLRKLGTPEECEQAGGTGVSSCWWGTWGNEQITFYFKDGLVVDSRISDVF